MWNKQPISIGLLGVEYLWGHLSDPACLTLFVSYLPLYCRLDLTTLYIIIFYNRLQVLLDLLTSCLHRESYYYYFHKIALDWLLLIILSAKLKKKTVLCRWSVNFMTKNITTPCSQFHIQFISLCFASVDRRFYDFIVEIILFWNFDLIVCFNQVSIIYNIYFNLLVKDSWVWRCID